MVPGAEHLRMGESRAAQQQTTGMIIGKWLIDHFKLKLTDGNAEFLWADSVKSRFDPFWFLGLGENSKMTLALSRWAVNYI